MELVPPWFFRFSLAYNPWHFKSSIFVLSINPFTRSMDESIKQELYMWACHASPARAWSAPPATSGGGGLKALVWFWWINETLSANLVYQSDHEIGSTIPSGGAMLKIMMMVWWPWWSSAWTWKRRKRKTKNLRQRWNLIWAFWFGDRDT
jgi:hypothetical protein